jgi:hypothetical protein
LRVSAAAGPAAGGAITHDHRHTQQYINCYGDSNSIAHSHQNCDHHSHSYRDSNGQAYDHSD